MKLEVLKTFNGKDEGKLLNPGDMIASNDVTRINNLVARGLCKIVSLADDPNDETDDSSISFRSGEYELEDVKKALNSIGVKVANNAKLKGVSKAIETLSDEQADELYNALNVEVNE